MHLIQFLMDSRFFFFFFSNLGKVRGEFRYCYSHIDYIKNNLKFLFLFTKYIILIKIFLIKIYYKNNNTLIIV